MILLSGTGAITHASSGEIICEGDPAEGDPAEGDPAKVILLKVILLKAILLSGTGAIAPASSGEIISIGSYLNVYELIIIYSMISTYETGKLY